MSQQLDLAQALTALWADGFPVPYPYCDPKDVNHQCLFCGEMLDLGKRRAMGITEKKFCNKSCTNGFYRMKKPPKPKPPKKVKKIFPKPKKYTGYKQVILDRDPKGFPTGIKSVIPVKRPRPDWSI